MVFADMKPMLLHKWGVKLANSPKKVFKHSRKYGPKSLSKIYMKAESKQATSVESSEGGRKHETIRKPLCETSK
jgi:hypothetical protein